MPKGGNRGSKMYYVDHQLLLSFCLGLRGSADPWSRRVYFPSWEKLLQRNNSGYLLKLRLS